MTTPIEPNPSRWSPSTDPASIVVPGLDTNAPINDQIDQIEQLITIKLQNIDANFSKIQHLMATRLLPAVKRYALGTEPVREAAKFWTSFYEQAAQVHIPTLEDYDSVHDEQTQSSVADPELASVPQPEESDVTSRTPPQTTTKSYDVTGSENSFMPTNAVSSTPARPGHAPDRTVDDHPSWSASLESPMVRLKSELQSFAREEEEEVSARQDTSSLTDSLMDEEEDTIQLPPVAQEKAKKGVSRPDRDEPRAKIYSSYVPRSAAPTPRANATNAYVSPLKLKSKTPIAIPKHIQAFLPAKLDNEPKFSSPRRPRYERTPRKPTAASPTGSTSTSRSTSALDIPSLTKQTSDSNQEPKFTTAFNDSFDDSVDLMQGMSPPRMLEFARAPRSSVGLGLLPPLGRTPGKDLLPTLGRTPGKVAADRIRRDLLGDMDSQFGSMSSAVSNKMRTPAFGYGVGTVKDDTMSTIPTPPSLSRYMRHAYPSWTDSNDTDTSLATMMRRVGLEMPESGFKADSVAPASHSRASSQADVASSVPVSPIMDDLHTPDHQALGAFDLRHDQIAIQSGPDPHANADSDSDSDSLNDEPVHPSQPSTAFLMASSREPDPDDSFGSSNHSSDSLGADEFGGGSEAAVHPFARAFQASGEDGDGFDDSFDSEGGHEAGQGEEMSGVTDETVFGIPRNQRRQQGMEPGQLRLLGEDLLQDTIGIGGQLAKVGRVEESPTPYYGRDKEGHHFEADVDRRQIETLPLLFMVCRTTPSLPDFYGLLQIPRDAPPESIKFAYHRALLRLHPDKRSQLRNHNSVAPPTSPAPSSTLTDPTPDPPPDAWVDMALLKEAYETLSNVNSRATYDGLLKRDKDTNDHARSCGPRPAQVVSLEDFVAVTAPGSGAGAGPGTVLEWRYGCRCGGSYRITEGDLDRGTHLVGCEGCSEAIWVGYEEVEISEDKEGE